MRLTNQLKAELATIEDRISYIMGAVIMPISMDSLKLGSSPYQYGEQLDDVIQELSDFKVQLENILCETDIKEQDHTGIPI